ncbi:MAG: type I-C CRISPR-associated protein Cas8c/Csd1 [Candidatus Hydrogenedentes bacterium]|jgi:CRISPR-associated protein Csd1|nr:type I-C CRISPR-associated protein Cas8c/Csd1 [Candidatus Hydrogenedentota bacterium]
MILQSLKEYYDRKAADPESDIAPEGFERREIPFLIVIDKEGNFITLKDNQETDGKKKTVKSYVLPRSCGRTGPASFKTTFLLWDHYGYVLEHPEDDEKTPKQHRTWLDQLHNLPPELKEDEGVAAIIKFYEKDGIKKVKAADNWKDCVKIVGCNMTFQIDGDMLPIPCRPAVQSFCRKNLTDRDAVLGRCLVTGEYDEIKRIHFDIIIGRNKGKLVGFQKNSGYDSYGKEQAYNAPVSSSAEFAYTTALKILLNSENSKMKIGDATAVFWSEKESELEKNFLSIFDPPEDDPDRGTRAVKSLFNSIKTGALSVDEGNIRFYVLGLAWLSLGRVTVRFWNVDTVMGMSEKIVQHFEDTEIIHGPNKPDTISLFKLIQSTAALGKPDNILPNLAADTIRAILQGLPYPKTLLQAAIQRGRAEQNISYERAALIKACLNRSIRKKNATLTTQERELTVSLDESNVNIGYRLGRLFATLEKIQEEANPGLNATIRDRFYGAASGTPVAVFANLMRLKNHHLSKLENQGRRVNLERLIGEIMKGITDFPTHLSLNDQGRFAIGYYHQRQDFFTTKIKDDTSGNPNNEEL